MTTLTVPTDLPPRPGRGPFARMVARPGPDGDPAAAPQRRAAAPGRGHPADRAGRRGRRARTGSTWTSGRARRRPHPRGARARGDVDRLHLAGDRHRVRAPVRRPQAAGRLPAAPVRPAPGQGRRAAGRRAPPGRSISLVALALGWSPDGCVGTASARWCRAARTAAFASLGLLIAGTLRAEATLAAANLVYLLLMAGGAVVIPSTSLRRVRPPCRAAALRRARQRHAGGPARRRAARRTRCSCWPPGPRSAPCSPRGRFVGVTTPAPRSGADRDRPGHAGCCAASPSPRWSPTSRSW